MDIFSKKGSRGSLRSDPKISQGWLASIGAAMLLLATDTSLASPDEFKRHTVGVFVGGTDEDGGSTEFTYGLEYGYRATERFGGGLVYERTENGHGGDGVTVALANLYYNPFSSWRIGLGVGQERVGGGHGTETLFRASMAYHFHFRHFGLSPALAIDSVDGNYPIVFGISLTRSF